MNQSLDGITKNKICIKSCYEVSDRIRYLKYSRPFVNLGIASKTQFKDNVSKYELLREREHHHHVVCDGCGSIEDVPFDEDSMLRYIQKQTKFEIKSHLLEFFGLCTRCQRA